MATTCEEYNVFARLTTMMVGVGTTNKMPYTRPFELPALKLQLSCDPFATNADDVRRLALFERLTDYMIKDKVLLPWPRARTAPSAQYLLHPSCKDRHWSISTPNNQLVQNSGWYIDLLCKQALSEATKEVMRKLEAFLDREAVTEVISEAVEDPSKATTLHPAPPQLAGTKRRRSNSTASSFSSGSEPSSPIAILPTSSFSGPSSKIRKLEIQSAPPEPVIIKRTPAPVEAQQIKRRDEHNIVSDALKELKTQYPDDEFETHVDILETRVKCCDCRLLGGSH